MTETRPLFARRLSRAQLIALDCLAAWGFSVVFLAGAATADMPLWVRLAIPLGLALPLALRRRWPRAVFAVVLVFAVAAMALDVVGAPYAAPAYALYLVGLVGGGRVPVSGIAVVSAFAGVALAALGMPSGWGKVVGDVLFSVAAMGGAWTLGRAVGERREYAARSAERLARESVAEERLRIARELHDVVAHSVGLIAVKAGVANHVLRSRPEEAHEALRVIETSSRSALVEMRRLLGVLRTEPPGLGPLPGLAALPELAERTRLAGVAVDLDVRDAGGVPEGVGLSVYRIVQEALTNVVKHAAPARCRVLVEAGAHEVRIEVTDDGPGRRTLPAREEGHGLIGMRERVMLYGGAFEAGPGPDKGFRVRACLPYQEIS
ncbi:histidine kinase [Nonomuraea sp. NPDC046570]|uniref:sensor histidine kinase n=1 Tax=Nonomuraea sp. NPDC046570 TaxID=3155255 RepID=UPI0033DE98D7